MDSGQQEHDGKCPYYYHQSGEEIYCGWTKCIGKCEYTQKSKYVLSKKMDNLKRYPLKKGENMDNKEAFVETFKPEQLSDINEGLRISNPLNTQVGGSHYKDTKIQPVEYAHANKLDFFQGSVIKYITRFRSKNGRQDLEKAKHFIDLLIELEYGKESK